MDEREKPGTKFSGDDPGTWHPDGKALARSTKRQAAVQERERVALKMFTRGATYEQIGVEIDRAPSSVSGILRRALERRALEEGPSVEAARTLYVDRLETLLQAHMPLALGTYRARNSDGEEGEPAPPDVRSADLVMKILDKMLAVTAKVSDKGANVEIHLHGSEVDNLRERIAASLEEMHQKSLTVQAELGAAGTSIGELVDGELVEDQPPPSSLEAA